MIFFEKRAQEVEHWVRLGRTPHPTYCTVEGRKENRYRYPVHRFTRESKQQCNKNPTHLYQKKDFLKLGRGN